MKLRLGVLLITIVLLCSSCQLLTQTPKAEQEFRGVWIATTLNLDYPSKPGLSANALREEADVLLDQARDLGMNAVILQVRPCGDAIYPSDYYPWAQVLSGTQGVTPDEEFDALAYWVAGAHKRGLAIHAWVNPFRVTQGSKAELSENNPARLHPEWVVKNQDGKCYLNPGIPEVRQYVVDGVREIVKRYAVDGIQFDDYFYPGKEFPDSDTFAEYGTGGLLDWRRENINALIEETHGAVHQERSDVVFGVSPFGIWRNLVSTTDGSATYGLESYVEHATDSRRWVKEGWVDYIAPQLYWSIGDKAGDYEALLDWWADVVHGTNVKLYIGHAGYRALEAEPGSVWYGAEEIKRQLAMNHTRPDVSGSIHFRIGTYLKTPELVDALKSEYLKDVE